MKTGSKEAKWLIFSLIFAASLYFLETGNSLSAMHSLAQKIADPLRYRANQTKNSLGSLFSLGLVARQEVQIFTLEKEKSELLSRLANYKTLEEENKSMRRLLDAGLPSGWKFSPAQVVSRVADALYLVGDDRPQPNTVVLVTAEVEMGEMTRKTGVFVAKVEDQVGRQTKSLLITDINSKVPAVVRDRESFERQASGILEGRGGKVVLEQVLSAETLKDGDLVFTSGEADYPAELLLGSISRILTSNNSALQQAEVKPALDLSKITTVFFLTKY